MGGIPVITEVRHRGWVNLFIFLLAGYATVFLQARLLIFRDIFGFQFDLMPGLVAYAAMHFTFRTALPCVAILGLMFDLLSANPLGTAILSYTLVAFVVASLKELLLSEEFTAQFVLGAAATAGSMLASLFILRMVGAEPLVGAWTLWIGALVSTGGGLATPLWFKLFKRLDDALSYKEVAESSFRSDRQIARGRY